MERIVVAGPPCSGKTTLAREIASRHGLPHTELDELWWEPGWTAAGSDRFRAKAQRIVSGERWVMDGNYLDDGATEVIYPRADVLVWLDFPRRVTVPRAAARTLSRALRGTELWSGNREPRSHALRLFTLLRRAIATFPEYNAALDRIAASGVFPHLSWVRLRGPSDVRRWLSSIGPVE